MTFRSILVAAVAATALAACAPATEQAGLGSPESQTTLVVENNNWSEMVIYVMRGAARSRLGSVGSMSSAQFRITDTMVNGLGEVRIMADPVGSEKTYTSPVINVVPGARVDLKLQNHLAISYFSVSD
ncbi:MAG TPA: hypothetical protein VGD27_15445 [Longimicrobiales bacterium]